MAKTLTEEVLENALELGKDIAKEVIKSGENIAGIESKEDGESSVLSAVKKILPKNPLE